jgi:two-component system sensor histidine kinase HydH
MTRFSQSFQAKLLASAAGILAASTLVSGLLAYQFSRNLLQPRLTDQLVTVVASTKSDIESALHVHAQNLKTWAGLDLMRELIVSDIDKTVSAFLSALHQDYGTYSEISAFGTDATCIASSDPFRIGGDGPAPELAPQNGKIRVRTVAREGQPARVELLTAIPSPSGTGGPIGTLRATLSPFLLEGIVTPSLDSPESWVALSDSSGSVMAGRLPTLDEDAFQRGAQIHQGEDILGADWSLVAAMPRSVVAGPIARLRNSIFLAGGLVGLLGVIVAWLLSRSLLVPIQELTETTSRIAATGRREAIPAPRSADEVGNLTRSFQTMMDNLAAADERLIQSSKLAFLGEMAAGLAHEIRTPLGIMKNAAQLLERKLKRYNDDEALEYTVFIREEVDRLNAVVTDMLDVARPAHPDNSLIALDGIVDRAVAFLGAQATAAGVTIQTEHQQAPLHMTGDGGQLYQAVLNLTLNASQACSRGDNVLVETLIDNDEAVVRVTDTGCGIPEKFRERLFVPFTTRRDGGIGLGLAIVARIAASHGGRVDSAPRPNGGSVFTMSLPLTTDQGSGQ